MIRERPDQLVPLRFTMEKCSRVTGGTQAPAEGFRPTRHPHQLAAHSVPKPLGRPALFSLLAALLLASVPHCQGQTEQPPTPEQEAEQEKLGLLLFQQAQAQNCLNQMRQIQIDLCVYSMDHGDHYPSNLFQAADEQYPLKFMVCPADTNHIAATNLATAGPTNVTFEFRLAGQRAGDPPTTNVILYCPVHQAMVLENGTTVRGRLAPPNIDWAAHAKRKELLRAATPAQREQLGVALENHQFQVRCDGNLVQDLLAVKSYAINHDDRRPTKLDHALSEIPTPAFLYCPADADKSPASQWRTYSQEKNLSYKLLNPNEPLSEKSTNQPVIVCPVHGRAIYSDGKVRPYGSPAPGSGKPPIRA